MPSQTALVVLGGSLAAAVVVILLITRSTDRSWPDRLRNWWLEVFALALATFEPVFFVVAPSPTEGANLVWAAALAVVGAAVAKRNPRLVAQHGPLAIRLWTLVAVALAGYSWYIGSGEYGGMVAFAMIVVYVLPLWLVGSLGIAVATRWASGHLTLDGFSGSRPSEL